MTGRPITYHDRRQFLSAVSKSVAAVALTPALAAKAAEERTRADSTKICVFTKPFNSLSFDELADRIAELGFDGIEAPIRCRRARRTGAGGGSAARALHEALETANLKSP